MEKLKISTEKNHYFLYSSFFQKNDYCFNHIEANDIGHWSQVIGILFNIDLFDKFIINNNEINESIRNHVQDFRLVLMEYMGYNDEESLVKINSMIDQDLICERDDARMKYLGVPDLILLMEKENKYRKLILIMEQRYKLQQALIYKIQEESDYKKIIQMMKKQNYSNMAKKRNTTTT